MTIVFILGLLLSAIIGLSLGLIGGGGSILTVPILVYFLGVEPHEAVTMSLAVVGATSLFGSYLHYRRDNIDLRSGIRFGGAGIVGAILGSPLTKLVSSEALLMIFGVLMFVVAIAMIWRRQHQLEESESVADPVKELLAGLGVGILTGFLGVGGGFLIVPALVLFGGIKIKKAIGTSLFVIFLNCIAGLVGHLGQENFNWSLTAIVIGLAVAGAIGGTILSHRIAADRLQNIFAVLVLGVGAFLVVKNYAILF
jgi:uncharacterized membrane protein YfcA